MKPNFEVVRPIFLLITAAVALTSCKGTKTETPLDRLLHSVEKDASRQEMGAAPSVAAPPKDAPVRSLVDRARDEMMSRIDARLEAVGTPAERVAVLKKIATEPEPPPSYLYQIATVDAYLFNDFLLKSMRAYETLDLTKGEELTGEGGSVKGGVTNNAETKDSGAKSKDDVEVKKTDEQEIRTLTPKEFQDRIDKRASLETFPGGFIADVFVISAPVDTPRKELFAIAEKLKRELKPPLNETSLQRLKADWKSLLNAAPYRDLKDTLTVSVERGKRFLHAGVFATNKGFPTPPPLVDEPPKTLVNDAGELVPDVAAKDILSDLYTVQNIKDKSLTEVAFYMKVVDVPKNVPSQETLKDEVIDESVYATSEWLLETKTRELIKKGDWSFYPKNLKDNP